MISTMKSKTRWINGLFVTILLVSGCGAGFLVGNLVIGEYNPPWEHYQLETSPNDLVKIEFVEIKSDLFDPTGDIVYASDRDDKIYSNIVFQDKWSTVDPVSTWENDRPADCTSERLGPTESHLWDNPPVEKGIIDSAGVIFERPVSTIVRCYVLLEDGNLEVWVHSGNAMDLMAGKVLKLVFASFGLILGVIISVIVLRYGKKSGESSSIKAS
jgi:hypothetical protein